MSVPHVFTYAGLIRSGYKTYWGEFDESRRRSIEDANVMRRDCFLMSLLNERMRSVATLPWHLETEDENDPEQKKVRDHLDKAVRAVSGYRRIIWLLLEALWYGRYGVQVKWTWVNRRGQKTLMPAPGEVELPGITPTMVEQPGPEVKTLSVRHFEPVNGDKIRHQTDGTPYVTVAGGDELPGAEYISGTAVGGKGLLLRGSWRQRFLIHTHEQEDSDFFDLDRIEAVHGLGIRDRIFWMNFMRQEYLAQISDFLGRVGLGITAWFYEYGNDAAKTEAEKAAREQSGQVNVVLPMDSRGKKMAGVERIEVPVAGAQFLDALIQPFRQDIERYVVGQSGSARSQSSGLGNEASAEFMQDTKAAITMVDADRLEESLTGTADAPGLVWMMQHWTFPGSTPEAGGFRVRWKFDVESKKSKGALEAGKQAWEMGVSLKADEVREKAGFSKPGEHDEVLEGKKEQAPAPGMGGGGNGLPPGGGPPDNPPPPDTNGSLPPALADRVNGSLPPGGNGQVPHARNGKPLAYVKDAAGHEHKGAGPGGGQFTGTGGGAAAGKKGAEQPAAADAHPGTAHGSTVKVTKTKERAFSGEPAQLATTLTKQETGRVGEAVSLAYLKTVLGRKDARPMNSSKTNFPVDALEDHAPTEIKAGLASNTRGAQQWRLTFSKESKKEKMLYESMTPEEKKAWNAEKQARIHARKQAVIRQLEKETGEKITPRTMTCIINPDTKTADIFIFDGLHDRIDWQSDMAKRAYHGSVRYG